MRGRQWVKASVAAIIVAILYRYWLITPVLEYLSLNDWRAVASAVSLALGIGWGLCRWNIPTLLIGFVLGTLIGGTWAHAEVPNDVEVSVARAVASHLESFWIDIIILTVTVSIGVFGTTHFRERRARRGRGDNADTSQIEDG